MRYRTIAFVSLGLWLVTAAVAVRMFVFGRTAASTDQRRAILLEPAERDLVLQEMRGMLNAVQGIVQGVRARDSKQVASAARSTGMAAAADINPVLMAKLPLEFKTLGMSVHKGFDDMAAAAEKGSSSDEQLEQLSRQLAACTGCHAGYRLDPGVAKQ